MRGWTAASACGSYWSGSKDWRSFGTSGNPIIDLEQPAVWAVISLLHPFQAHRGWRAPFIDSAGRRWFAREHEPQPLRLPGEFRSARLQVVDCSEPKLTADQMRAKGRAFRHIPEATTAAYVGLSGVLVWDLQKPRAME